MSPAPGCLVCGDPANSGGMIYRCAYCGEPVCESHRLPENHGCSGSRLPQDESPAGRRPKPMELAADQTVGTTPGGAQPGADSSPDVAPDGTLVSEGETDDDDGEQRQSFWRRLLPFL